MNLVLDVDAAIALSLGRATKPLVDAVATSSRVLVPELFDFEATNVVWRYLDAGMCSPPDASLLLDRTLDWPDTRVAGRTLAIEALALARESRHPAYDMFYIALARHHDAFFATLDRALARLAGKLGLRTLPLRTSR